MKINKLYIMLFIALMAIISACSDDDDDISSEKDPNEEIISDDAFRFAEVVDKMFAVDTSRVSKTEYVPLNGKVLDESAPTVYTLGMESSKEAYYWFLTHCLPSDEIETYALGGEKEVIVNFGTYGTITYTPVNSAAMYGIITLNLDINTMQKTLELIPSVLWPENKSSLFYLGDVVIDSISKEHYICVRACEGGKEGILLSFGKKWEKDDSTNYQDFHDKKKGWFKVPRGISGDAWDALCQWAYDDTENFRGLIEYLKETFPKLEIYKQNAILSIADYPQFRDESYLYVMGTPYGYKHLWCARQVWKLYLTFVHVGRKNIIAPKNSLPYLEREEKKVADHKWAQWPCFQTGVREERFINNKDFEGRFKKVFEAN